MSASRSTEELWQLMAKSKIYDLAQPLERGMPVSPNHPGFKMALMRRHGDHMRADGGSAANEIITIGGHTGTHIDALCHVSHDGLLHGGFDASEAQIGGQFKKHGAETLPLCLSRGVLLDIAGLRGVDVLEPGEAVTAEDLQAAADRQGIEVRAGDVALVRTGWPRYWQDAVTFLGAEKGAPGPDESGANWLVEKGVQITGAETVAYEQILAGRGHALLPVHRILLVEAGVPIVEMLDLTELAADEVFEFLFILTPLKITGATGVPVRPIAVVSEAG